MVQWLLPAAGQRLATLVALAALTACAGVPGQRQDEAAAGGWRVIERIGETRFLPFGEGSWRATITGRPIGEGSEVVTGPGGRLIIAQPGRHISVGPSSRFVLPHPHWSDRLEQRAGWLRYRVEERGGEPFRVRTRSLEIEFVAAVLDVRVEQDAVDVTVTEGKVRLATPDNLRRIEIAAGQSAQAGGRGNSLLAVRRAPEEDLEPVQPLIVPAVRPKREQAPSSEIGPQDHAPEPAEPSPAQPVHLDRTGSPPPHDAQAAGRGLSRPSEEQRALRSAGPLGPAPAVAAPASAEDFPAPSTPSAAVGSPSLAGGVDAAAPEAGRRGQFQRLTAGMIDGVRSPSPDRVRR